VDVGIIDGGVVPVGAPLATGPSGGMYGVELSVDPQAPAAPTAPMSKNAGRRVGREFRRFMITVLRCRRGER
jgi:hypothetical protein